MRGQIDRLTKLTTDLLDLSKIDADALALRSGPVDLIAIASEAAEEFEAIASQREASIELQVAEGQKPLAQADYTRTMQIMRILIDNAIKHTHKGTEITINTQMDGDSAVISVTDDGPGIDPAERELVFERFHTADSAGGSGLGLAISRELARRMGGELILRSRRGRTVFTLTLPAARTAAA
jgi:signal transduction histidine kinase